MKPERWDEIKQMIKKQFEVEYEDTEQLEEVNGTCEIIEFDGPLGLMKVEFITKPKQLGRKVHASNRIGGGSREEILHSDSEMVSYLHVFTWDDDADDWKEIQQELFS